MKNLLNLARLIPEKKALVFFLCFGFILFANLFPNAFVWSDNTYITNNGEAQNFNIYELLDGNSLTGIGYYRPLAALYFTGIYALSQHHAFVFHALQILLYSFTAYLVYVFFERFFNKKLSFLLSLLFFVHPMNQGIVAFISSSADIFFMFFGLLAALVSMQKIVSIQRVLAVSLLLFLCILSKETAIVFFAGIVLLQLFFFPKNIKKYVLTQGITLTLYIGIRILFHGFYFGRVEMFPLASLSFVERLMNIPQIFLFYISKFLIPFGIGGAHGWSIRTISLDTFYLPLAIDMGFVALLIGIFLFLKKRKSKYVKSFLFFFLLFWIGIMPFLQLIPLDYTVAARWFYFSMVALLGMIGAGVMGVYQWKGKIRTLLLVLFVLYCGILAVRTVHRNTTYKDNLTLFTSFERTEDNFNIQQWLAYAYVDKKDYKSALIHIQQSVDMFPYDNNLVLEAYIYQKLGETKKANDTYHKALRANNYYPGRHDNTTYRTLARYLILSKQFQDARRLLAQGVKDFPKDSYLWELLAISQYARSHPTTAYYSIGKALLLSPNDPGINSVYTHIHNNDEFEIIP